MAATVSFKVFLMTEDATSNEAKQEVRRFGIDRDVVTNFLYLNEKLQTVFASLRGRRFTVSWKDSDGDYVIISSDEELKIALAETELHDVRKLYVTLRSEYPNEPLPNDEPRLLHVGVTCDGCDRDVQGFRYKCIQCSDYDLCAECEAKGLHPEHCMIRSAIPMQWKPHFGRRLAHHMNKFARKSGHCHAKERETTECPYKKGRYHGPAGRSTERPTWLDNLATYLNDWSYPTADGDCPTKDASAPQKEGETSKETPNQQQRPNPHAEFFKNIGENLANLLDPLGIDVTVQADPPSNKKDSDKEKSGPSTKNNSGTSTPKFPGEGKKLVEAPVPSETSTSKPETSTQKPETSTQKPETSTQKPETTPENNMPPRSERPSPDSEEWTLLNQTEPSGATAAEVIRSYTTIGAIHKQPTPSAPETSTATNLIYPILPKPSEPAIFHPDPKIQRAVVAMMQMGFSNDGGWLTQLLASHHGDISKALDILQPVGATKDGHQLGRN